ncbi:MAG: phosphoenolpyruvate-protein phosphotransferase [Nocardioides sp.]|nr:phosphoenolpyruvate-protein phosphotransferase [Nocardioides sp.]
MILQGIPASGGCALGPVVMLEPAGADVDVTARSTRPVPESLDRLSAAVAASRDDIVAIAATARERIGAENSAIVEAQLLVLDDPEWLDPVVAAIRDGATPEGAVWAVSQEVAGLLAALDDPYLAERSADVLDVGQRVVGHLTDRRRAPVLAGLEGDVIIGAYELTPTDTLALDLEVVRGIVTEVGSRTAHAAIIARQLGIPAVVGASGLLDAVCSGDVVLVDGDQGTCTLDPGDAEVARARSVAAARANQAVIVERVATSDGVEIVVLANAGSILDVERAVGWGADGIGLFRTEFLFMQSEAPPDEEEQAAYYAAVARAAQGRPVTFRTLDIGGDKPVPGLHVEAEANPFLGVRGVRLTLADRDLFAAQLRALARTAAAYPEISVMVPMVSGLEELDEVRALLAECAGETAFRFGTMIEVPSAAVLAAEVAAEVDFLSVGTNDLTAYVLAADRGNTRLDYLYDEFHPAVLRTLRLIRVGAGATPVSICGELAGDPRALALLVGLGYHRLSVSGPLVPVVKERVRELEAAGTADGVAAVLAARRRTDVTAALDLLAPRG